LPGLIQFQSALRPDFNFMKQKVFWALLIGWLSANDCLADSAPKDAGAPVATWTVTNSLPATNTITFAEFLSEVVRANLDYAAQRYNLSIAQAAVAAAKEFKNPSLQMAGERDVSHSGSERMPSTYGATLTQTIELGGKRKYRILGARQNYAAAAATLESFFRNLKLDAATAFADALALFRTAQQKRQTAEYLRSLLMAQSERLRAGDVGEVDVLQTQIEAQQVQNELLSAQAEAQNASIGLSAFLGRDRGQTLLLPKGNLEIPSRDYELQKLIVEALQNRSDLIALRHTRDAAQSKIREETANRVPDVDIGPAWTHNTESENSIAPSPTWDSLGLSVTLPLPLWNRNKAAIATARFTAEQAQKQLEAAELKAEVQIRQNYTSYKSALERLRRYQGSILRDADTVLEAKRFSYQRGQTTLLELLDAQRTNNEVRQNYIEALADLAKALIELERATELWEIDFP
jgi:cobalt-zinc-cadmium efflux system outer membrane protein